jgi:hypothetical protein
MFNFDTQSNLTARRKAYAVSIFDNAAAMVARDLDAGTTDEGVAITALAQIIAAYLPPTGKGHADRVREQVADAVAALRSPDAAQEAPAQEAPAQEAPAQEAPARRRKAA